MKKSIRQSMAWLHGWVGLMLGWVLFVIFALGSLTYFKSEITAWMQPERLAIPRVDPAVAAEVGARALQSMAPDAERWYLALPSERMRAMLAYWQDAGPQGGFHQVWINPESGRPVMARESLGGEFFYQMHYELYGLPGVTGRIIVGIAAMAMLVALVSGVITHRKIFQDFFTLRLFRGMRSWLDLHNVTAVVALPFYLVITYTGLMIFFYLYMPWGIMARYGADAGKLFDEVQRSPAFIARSALPEQHASDRQSKVLPQILQQASQVWGTGELGAVEVVSPPHHPATVIVSRRPHTMLNDRMGASLAFDATSGAPLPNPANTHGMAEAAGVMYGLHEAHFASLPLRGLLCLTGLLGAAMIATGLILWSGKRLARLPDRARVPLGYRLVEGLNVMVIAGLPLSIAVYLCLNRILPVAWPARAEWEVGGFFAVWLLAGIHALVRRVPRGQIWREQVYLIALAYAAIPVCDLLLNQSGWQHAVGSSVLWGVDTVALAVALIVWGGLVALDRMRGHQRTLELQERIS